MTESGEEEVGAREVEKHLNDVIKKSYGQKEVKEPTDIKTAEVIVVKPEWLSLFKTLEDRGIKPEQFIEVFEKDKETIDYSRVLELELKDRIAEMQDELEEKVTERVCDKVGADIKPLKNLIVNAVNLWNEKHIPFIMERLSDLEEKMAVLQKDIKLWKERLKLKILKRQIKE